MPPAMALADVLGCRAVRTSILSRNPPWVPLVSSEPLLCPMENACVATLRPHIMGTVRKGTTETSAHLLVSVPPVCSLRYCAARMPLTCRSQGAHVPLRRRVGMAADVSLTYRSWTAQVPLTCFACAHQVPLVSRWDKPARNDNKTGTLREMRTLGRTASQIICDPFS